MACAEAVGRSGGLFAEPEWTMEVGSEVAGAKGDKKRSRGTEDGDGDKDGIKLPKSTMKRIMKINSDVGAVSLDGVAGACHATELFLTYLAEQSGNKTQEAGRKIMKLEDINAAVEANPNFAFLKDCFGPPVDGAARETPAPVPDSETN